MYKYWSNKEVSLLKKFYPKLIVRELAKMFPNRTKATIAVKAFSLGLPSAKLWQSEENDILYKDFAEASEEKLLKLLPKRSWSAILAQGERIGLKRKIDGPKLRVNEDYFKKWSSNMAYILGFIFADGSIIKVTHNGCSDRLSFGQSRKDIDILRKIKQKFSAEQTLSIGEKYVHFSIHSQVIVDDLKKLEVTYRKSFRKTRGKIPNIPYKYIRDFIRGIVDGDGSINFNKKGRQKGYPNLSICGKKEVMAFIRDHFLSKFNIYSKISQGKKNGKLSNVFYICYRCNSAKTLINYLYNNANLYLKRKFKLAKQCSKIEMKHRKNYNKQENKIIQEFYSLLPKNKFFLKLPNRSWSSIQQQTRKLGIYKYKIKNKLCA
ncbi:MAG: LAGLIDADG family homing endonuclease [bacterium]|nr:LAGLIDADG family homing endonuclease [bacterium]